MAEQPKRPNVVSDPGFIDKDTIEKGPAGIDVKKPDETKPSETMRPAVVEKTSDNFNFEKALTQLEQHAMQHFENSEGTALIMAGLRDIRKGFNMNRGGD